MHAWSSGLSTRSPQLQTNRDNIFILQFNWFVGDVVLVHQTTWFYSSSTLNLGVVFLLLMIGLIFLHNLRLPYLYYIYLISLSTCSNQYPIFAAHIYSTHLYFINILNISADKRKSFCFVVSQTISNRYRICKWVKNINTVFQQSWY